MDASFSPAHALAHASDLHDFDLDTPQPDAHRDDAQHGAARAVTTASPTAPTPAPDAGLLHRGQVMLDSTLLRHLRQTRLMSQQDLANDCWRRNIQVSIATIKRAESGRAVRFRIARELARCFDIPVVNLVQGRTGLAAQY